MGRRTLVDDALAGVPAVQAKLDGSEGGIPSDVQTRPGRHDEASAPVMLSAPISILDLFGPPATPGTGGPGHGARGVEACGGPTMQRKAAGAAVAIDDAPHDTGVVGEIAGRGVSGTGSPLPHLERIQTSFGHHDVSGVQAHQGAAAATAAHELGATAYASGNAVAFAASPDLHTAAHEAAHVVQQRGGVQLKGGIDRPGDDYERHADAVADAVVAGRPADGLLDQVAGAASSAPAVVQRKAEGVVPASAENQRRAIEIYLAVHQRNIWAMIGEHARSVSFPEPTARLSWTKPRAFVRELLMQLEANINDFTPLAKLDEILHPSNAARTVGALLPSTGTWSSPVGLAIAQALLLAIVSSLHRLGPRYLAVADSSGSAGEGVVTPSALVYSMPIDRYVGAAMCAPHTLTIEPPEAKATAKAKGRFTGVRSAKLAWEGERDPHLWNWVRATEPADATAEDVAAALWTVTHHHGDTNAAFNAYLLAAAPPLFGVPKKFAIKHPNLRQYAPAGALRGEDSIDAELIDVAASAASDGIALHQSPAASVTPPKGKATPAEPPPDLGAVLTTLGDCHLQLVFVTIEVTSWGLADRIMPAIGFVTRKESELATADAAALAAWNRVISGQRDRLFKVSGAIHNLAGTARKLGVKDPRAPEATPVREILEKLATAAGTSHLAQTSEAQLHEALALQATLEVRAVQATERELEGANLDFRATMGPKQTAGTAAFSHEVVALQDRSRQMQTTMLNGGEVDTAELDEVTLRSGEIALRERVLGTIHSTFDLQEAAMSAKEGIAAHIAMLFSGKFRNLESLCQHIRDRVAPIQSEMIATEQRIHDEEQSQVGTPAQKAKHRAMRRAVLAKAQAEFAQISLDEDLRTFFREGAKVVQNQQFRTACVKTAALIGIAVLAAATGGAAAELAGGWLMGAQSVATFAELSTAARIGATAVNLVADSAINAAGQSAVQGGSLGEAFVENLIMSFASTVLFGAIARYSVEAAKNEGRVAMTWAKAESFAQKALVVGREAGALTVHTVWGAAIGYVAHRAVSGHEPSPMEAHEWLLQGASVAIGRGVHKALGERMPGLERLAKRSAEAHRLVAEAKQLQQLALAVEHSKNAASAVELLDRRTRLLHEEIEALEKIVAKDGDPSGELGKARKDLEGQIHESNAQAMVETKFHLLGLEELVPGALWKGSHDQVQHAVDEARRSGGNASLDPHTRRWKLALDGRVIEIQEIAPAKDAQASRLHAEGPDDGARAGARHPEDAAASHHSAASRTIVLAGDDAQLRAAAERIQPRPGYIDVLVHASAHTFWLVREHVDIAIDHRALATYLTKHGLADMRLRLVACDSGQNRFAVAQDLANKLGVEVLAPSETAWVNSQGEVGVGPRDVDRGQWHSFKPKHEPVPGRPSKEPYREPEPMRTEDGSEVDAPLRVDPPHVDTRARVQPDQLAMLSAQLGAPVVIDPALHNGVEVRANQPKGLLGYDMTKVEVRVGTAALVSDIQLHARTIAGLRRYNGLLGKLRLLAERVLKGLRSKDGGAERKPFPPGSRGYVTQMELAKLNELIEARQAQHSGGLIDEATLRDELKFLDGEVAKHTETLQSMADVGYLHDEKVVVGAPDTGVVTREAKARGYQLPGEASGVAERADPNHYYYRRAQHDAEQFELARKPSAPADAPAYRARVVNGEFQGLVDAAAQTPKEVIPVELSKEAVVARLRETEGFGPYAQMLETHGIASRAVIDAAVETTRGRKNQAGDEVTLDWLRHEVKDHFRDRVMAKLLDPALDSAASYRNMRAMLDGLGNADRGTLCEVWYRHRYAPTSKAQVKYQVTRSSGENEGNVETRAADLVVDREAREVKDITGKIDEEQFGAYVDMLRDDKLRATMGIDKLRYVFTRPEGGIANLEFLASRMTLPGLEQRISVEVFDARGMKHVAATPSEAFALLKKLKAQQ